MQTTGHTVEEVGELQNILHETLTAFASGSVLQASKLLPGTRKNCLHPAWKERFHRLEVLSATDAAWPVDKNESCVYRNAANLLARGYRVLDVLIKEQQFEGGVLKPVCRRQLLAQARLHAGEEILHQFSDYWTPDFGNVLAGVYVHGSYSTEDTNAYSDLDTLLVLRRSVAKDGEALYRFGRRAIKSYRYLLQADLLQHHANFILTEIDLDYYCEAYFPTVLFTHATSLFQSEKLEIASIRNNSKEAIAHLHGMCQRFSRDWEHKHLTVAYHLKLQLSCFMILPAVLLEVLGKPCYKRESFLLAKPMFPAEIWSIMDAVSELRNSWRQADGPILKRLAWYHPLLWNQLVVKSGRWAVPNGIWVAVRDKGFRLRMGEFAKCCIALADKS